MNYRTDVFVSYSRKDTKEVDLICTALEEDGISYWRDRDEITAIEYDFPQRVLEGLKHAKLVILVLTPNFLDSFYCFTELLNILVDAPLSHPPIRVIVLDSKLANHPLIEISRCEAFSCNPDNGNIGGLKQWLKNSPRIDFVPFKFDLEQKSKRLLAEFISLYAVSSPPVIEFSENFIQPFLKLELIGHFLIQDRLKEAIALAEEIYSTLESSNNTSNFLIDVAGSRLAHAYSKYGLQKKAVSIRRKLFNRDVKLRGRANSETIHACDSLIISLSRLGEFDEALALAEANLAVAKKTFQSAHPLALLSASTLGGLYLDQGDYGRAKIIMEPAYNSLTESGLEKNSESYLIIKVNYGFACCRVGELVKAQGIFQSCIIEYSKINGENSTDVALTRIKLAETYCKQERFQEAAQQAIDAMKVLEIFHPYNPARIMAGVMTIQCCYLAQQIEDWHSMFDKFIFPGLSETSENGIGSKLKVFLIQNSEFIPLHRITDVIMSLRNG